MSDELAVAELAYRQLQTECDQWKNGYEVLSRQVAKYLKAVGEYNRDDPEPIRAAKIQKINFLRSKLEAHIQLEAHTR